MLSSPSVAPSPAHEGFLHHSRLVHGSVHLQIRTRTRPHPRRRRSWPSRGSTVHGMYGSPGHARGSSSLASCEVTGAEIRVIPDACYSTVRVRYVLYSRKYSYLALAYLAGALRTAQCTARTQRRATVRVLPELGRCWCFTAMFLIVSDYGMIRPRNMGAVHLVGDLAPRGTCQVERILGTC